MTKIFLELSGIFLFLTSCSHAPVPAPEVVKPPVVVLVHGAHFDGESWKWVRADLEAHQMSVLAPNLPGRLPFKNVNLSEMAKAVCNLLTEPSVLVGHSQGGAVINQMVAICPRYISKLVYVGAVVPLYGETAFQKLSKDDEKVYLTVAMFKKDRAEIKKNANLLNVMEPGVDLLARSAKVYSEPLAPGSEKLMFDPTVFDRIPKFYIHTSQDKIVSMDSQKKYTNTTNFSRILSIDSGHLPMLLLPQELSAMILGFVNDKVL